MIKGIIFDYDGVIVKTDPFNMHVLKEVLRERHLPFNEAIYGKFFLGRTLSDGFMGYLQTVGHKEEIEDLIKRKKSFDSEYADWVEAWDDALDFIREVKDKFKLAITSGTRKIFSDLGLKKLGLERVFDVVVTAEDYKKGKPNPEAYLTTLNLLQMSPKEVVVIEDAPSGVKAAKAAGMLCVAVTHTHSAEDLKEADLIVDILQKAYSFIKTFKG